MENSMNQTRYICGCCKKELPEESFYVNSKQHRDNYCHGEKYPNSKQELSCHHSYSRSGNTDGTYLPRLASGCRKYRTKKKEKMG